MSDDPYFLQDAKAAAAAAKEVVRAIERQVCIS
jgi:hypothetical protein